jgi:PAS domain S-box-containing protein
MTHKPSPILPYILKRVLPVTLLAMACLWFAVRIIGANTVCREVNQRVSAATREEASVIAERLNHIRGSVRDLAQNVLIINSLVDAHVMENYVPIFFHSLTIPGPARARMALTDYRGRVLASNRPDRKGYEKSPAIERVMEGKDHFSISSKGLEAAAPVLFDGLPEGMVIAAYGPEQVREILSITPAEGAVAVFDSQGECLFSSPGAPWKGVRTDSATPVDGWIEARQGIPGFDNLTLLSGEPEEKAFRDLNRQNRFFLVALVVTLLALSGSVVVTTRMVTGPLSALASKMDAITDLTHPREPIPESGPSELQVLAHSFNGLMTALGASTWNIQERMKELDCLYQVALVFETRDSLKEIFQETVNIVPQGMVYPEITCCRIVLEGEVYDSTPPCGMECETCGMACLSQSLRVYGKTAGEISVCYLEDRPQRDEGPFVNEERHLIDMIAERLGHAVERLRARDALKESEEALRASGEVLRAVLDAIPVRVFWKDANLVFLGCNAPFARDAGYATPEEVIGKDDRAMAWREQAERYRADDRAVLESGKTRVFFEEPQTTSSGNQVHLLTSKVPLRDAGGRIVGVLGAYVDITERKQAEEEVRLANEMAAMEAGRAQMSAMVLHHIGNAVTPLGIYVEEMKDKAENGFLEYLEKSYLDLRGHMDDLHAYLSENGRGRQVFEYMNALIQSLKEQQDQRQETIRKIDHGLSDILDILARQQRDDEEKKMGDGHGF